MYERTHYSWRGDRLCARSTGLPQLRRPAGISQHLDRRDTPYAAWDEIEAEKDVLTVDDSTQAGAEACYLAVNAGHEVIFFVNPWQISTGEFYFFSYWDAILDARTVRDIMFGGTAYDLSARSGLHAFRFAVREQVMGLPASDAVAAIQRFNALCGSNVYEAPHFSAPISTEQLRGLKRVGVRIESHGWSHVDVRSMNDETFAADLTRTAQWLSENLRIEPSLYAVPFGSPDLSPAFREIVRGDYMLVSRQRPTGRLDSQCINRRDITGLINGT